MKVGFLVAMLIAVSGQVLYHFMQKSVAPAAHPVLALIAFYLLAALASLPLFWLFPLTHTLPDALRQMNGAVPGVALAIVLIEFGFLLAYRAGADLSSAFVLSAAVVAASLLVIGLAAFGEAITPRHAGGLVLCLAGIWLLSGGRTAAH